VSGSFREFMSTDLVIATVSLAVLLVFVQSVRRATGIGVPWWAFAISVVLLTFVFPIGLLPLGPHSPCNPLISLFVTWYFTYKSKH
jgi:hypothetical protein